MKALKKAPERFVEVGWDGENESSYRVELQIDAYDRTRLLEDLSRTFSEAGINIIGASCTTNHPMVKNRFVVEVGDTEQLKQCISRLRNVESVFDAYRITPARPERSGDDRQRARGRRCSVELACARRCSRRRPGPGRAGRRRPWSSEIEAIVGRGDVVEVLDLAVAGGGALLAEEARDQGRHVALGGALEDAERERAVVDLDPLADPDRAAGEVGEGVGVLGQRGDPLDRLAASISTRSRPG